MREILFRGKTITSKEWIYGDLLQYAGGAQIWENTEQGKFNAQIIPETVGQYTGLTDKNGVKIFENDIVRYGKKNWVVNWNDETFRWEISLKDGCYQYPIYDGQGYPKYVDRITLGWVAAEFQLSGQLSVEVIGNKFDNPELIERDNNEKDWIF